MAKGSQKLSFTLVNNGGYSDWVAAVNVVQQDLKAIGIQVTPQNLAQSSWQSKVYAGKFQLGLRQRDRRAQPVLRAAPVALLGQLGPDRHGRRVQLGALQQPGHRRTDQPVRRHHRLGHRSTRS